MWKLARLVRPLDLCVLRFVKVVLIIYINYFIGLYKKRLLLLELNISIDILFIDMKSLQHEHSAQVLYEPTTMSTSEG